MIKRIAVVIILAASLSSCMAVKEYEKVNINDPDMTLADRKANRFHKNFHAYREAAAGANGGKSGGGCGCN